MDDFLPESPRFGARMMQDLALHIRDLGHDIVVVTPGPKTGIRQFHGMPIYVVAENGVKNTSRITRLLSEFRFPYAAWRLWKLELCKMQIDGVIYYSPSIFMYPLINNLCHIHKCRSYMVLRDIFPQWAVDTGILPDHSPITEVLRWQERLNYGAAHTIGAQTDGNRVFLERRFGGRFNFSVVHNWITPRGALKPPGLPKYQGVRDMLAFAKGRMIFFYGGNLGKAQNIVSLARLSSTCGVEGVAFAFIGQGDLQGEVKAICAGSNACLFHPAVSQEVYDEFLAYVDVGVLALDTRHTTHNVPGKLLNYLAMGLPIAGVINPGNDVADLIDGRAGKLIDTFNPEAFATLVREIRNNQNAYAKSTRAVLEDHFRVEDAAAEILSKLAG